MTIPGMLGVMSMGTNSGFLADRVAETDGENACIGSGAIEISYDCGCNFGKTDPETVPYIFYKVLGVINFQGFENSVDIKPPGGQINPTRKLKIF